MNETGELIRVTCNDKTHEIRVGTREVASLELRGHTQEDLGSKPVLALWLMAHTAALRLSKYGIVDFGTVPEVFDEFLETCTVEEDWEGRVDKAPKASKKAPSVPSSS